MNIKRLVFLTVLSLFFFTACGLQEGTINKEPKSYLIFTGTAQKVLVFIDDLEPFSVVPSKIEQPVRYEISPGKHSIKIERKGTIVVNRKVLLGNEVIKEIKVP